MDIPEYPTLTTDQIKLLSDRIHGGRVQTRNGNSYVEQWDIRRTLTKVFGLGGWDFRIVSLDLVSARCTPPVKDARNPSDAVKGQRHWATYKCVASLTVKDRYGRPIATFEDGAVGGSQNQPSEEDCHDQAAKSAVSGALKRCAVNLGDQFGLSLYNGGSLDPVVGWTLGRHAHGPGGKLADDVQPEPGQRSEQATESQQAQRPDNAAEWIAQWYEDLQLCGTLDELRTLWGAMVASHKANYFDDAERKTMESRFQSRKIAIESAPPVESSPTADPWAAEQEPPF